MWRYETDGIHPLRVTFVQTAFDHIQGSENANMIINLLEAGSVLHLVPNDEDQTTYGEIWHNLDRFLSNAGIGRDAGRIRNEDGKFH